MSLASLLIGGGAPYEVVTPAVSRADEGSVANVADTVAAVLSLPIGVRDRGARVRIRAIVTMWQPQQAIGVVQDATAGIWASCGNERVREQVRGVIRPGLEVVIEGTLFRGGYSPLLLMESIEFLHEVDLPPPKPADLDRIFVGGDNGLRVSCDGIVQGCELADGQLTLILACGSRRLQAQVLDPVSLPSPDTLVDSRVRVTGVVGSVRNSRGEFLAPRLVASIAHAIEIVQHAPATPADVPDVPLTEIGRYRFEPLDAHRIRTEGIVTYATPKVVFIQQGLCGVRVEPAMMPEVVPGDRVKVTGFVENVRRIAGIREAILERVESETPPDPIAIAPVDILRINNEAMTKHQMAEPSDCDGCLVEFPAVVVEARSRGGGNGGELVLASGGVTTVAELDDPGFDVLARLQPGSSVSARGIVQVHLLSDAVVTSHTVVPLLRQVTLLLRSAEDVQILAEPSWWTPRRLAMLLAGLIAILAGALVWVLLLRREVGSQSRLLAREMRLRRDAAIEYEASLRERNRLAANLHDTLLQTLGGIDYQLGACRTVSGSGGDLATEHLEVAGKMVEHATKELRGSVWALRTSPLAGHSFAESLEALLGHLGPGHSEGISLRISGTPFEMPNFVAGNLLLVTQEAVLNALHHAGGTVVEVAVAFDEPRAAIDLSVRDDGIGFEPGTQSGPEQGHFGLQGMRERVERLGGAITISSSPRGGTMVRAQVLTRDYDSHLEGFDASAEEPEQAASVSIREPAAEPEQQRGG